MKRFFNAVRALFKKPAFTLFFGAIVGSAITLWIYIINYVVDPSRDKNAVREVGRFRKPLAFRRGQGTYYDTAGFRKFIDTFGNLVKYAENPRHPPHNGKREWVIGFYWKRKEDTDGNGKVKYSFCM